MRLLFLFLFFCTSPLFSIGQKNVPNQSSLKLEQIMKGKEFVGHWPENPFWSEDSKSIYFDWNPDKNLTSDLYKVKINNLDNIKKTNIEEESKLTNRGYYSKDFKWKVYSKNGDIHLMNTSTGNIQLVTNTSSYESQPFFSADDQKIFYSQSSNLFSWDIKTGSTEQLTQFKRENKPKDYGQLENEKWLENDQYSYFDILRKRKEVDELRTAKNEDLEPKRPLDIYIGKKSVSSLKISPDQQFIIYRLTKRADPRRTKVPDFVTDSGYLNDLRSRPKVGSVEDSYETWIYDRKTESTYQLNIKDIPGIFDQPAFLKDYNSNKKAEEEKDKTLRKVIVHGPKFSTDGKAFVEIKALDNKDRWIMALDLSNGNLKLLDRQHDDAWIGGPGIYGWNRAGGNTGWMPDNKTIWFQSEESGYSHLYTMPFNGGKKKALTKGKFEIINVLFSRYKKWFYIVSNMDSPFEHHIYRLPVSGGKMEKMTTMKGGHEMSMSPDESQIAFRFSTSNQPWELYVMPNEPGAKATKITKSTTPEFDSYAWRTPEIIRFKAEDGAMVPAKLYKPKNPSVGGPAVIFVHGAGYLQNVHTWWGYYFREQMFHNLLCDNGYTVLDIDYRASEGYGRDWRTAIYRFMGGKDLDDQVDGAKYLVEKHGVNPDKIGIYGGSYGGFITLMAMFTKPGVFKAGAALRSVTDWAHYNHGYTSNILNTPVQDSIAFYKSSPIYHAEGLQDHLLILHGMIDTNVQYQDVVRLAQRLIELGKDNWELAVFPVEGHGFSESSSWADEYKRIFKLFQLQLNSE